MKLHSSTEPGMYREWHNGWHYEIAWGHSFKWFGLKYQQSRDGESGQTFSLGLWFASVYIVREKASEIERSVGAWADDQYVNMQFYRGNDEMNSMPMMWEWPWKRWHHIRCDTISCKRSFPYRYERENGEIQTTTATAHIEEREWHWIWKGNPFRRKVVQSLLCEFADPIGEGVDDWKGGTTGAGTDLLPGEDAVAALRRMERERRFRR